MNSWWIVDARIIFLFVYLFILYLRCWHTLIICLGENSTARCLPCLYWAWHVRLIWTHWLWEKHIRATVHWRGVNLNSLSLILSLSTSWNLILTDLSLSKNLGLILSLISMKNFYNFKNHKNHITSFSYWVK